MKAFILNFLFTWLFPAKCTALAYLEQINAQLLTERKDLEARVSHLTAEAKALQALLKEPEYSEHPLIRFLQEPKTWAPHTAFETVELEQIQAFFKSAACSKLDVAIHNIALQDMQRAWNTAAAQREFEIGAAQGRLAAWNTIKLLPESLTPQSEQPEAADTGTAALDHLRP